jgi:hypothetical protein
VEFYNDWVARKESQENKQVSFLICLNNLFLVFGCFCLGAVTSDVICTFDEIIYKLK